MKKSWCFLGCLMLLAFPAAAQDAPKAELFGGYSYVNLETGTGLNRLHLNGWNVSLAGNVNRWLGIVGDFSGNYGSQSGVKRNVHSFLFGPRFSYRSKGRVTPFVHALFGATRAHHDSFTGLPVPSLPAQDETKFSMALGGGLDVRASNALAFRVVQADYLLTPFDESSGIVCIQSITTPCTTAGSQHNFRLSAGIVFRFRVKATRK